MYHHLCGKERVVCHCMAVFMDSNTTFPPWIISSHVQLLLSITLFSQHVTFSYRQKSFHLNWDNFMLYVNAVHLFCTFRLCCTKYCYCYSLLITSCLCQSSDSQTVLVVPYFCPIIPLSRNHFHFSFAIYDTNVLLQDLQLQQQSYLNWFVTVYRRGEIWQ